MDQTINEKRKEWTEYDAIRDEGLIELTSIEKIRNLSYKPYGIENTYDIYYPKNTHSPLPTIVSIHGGGFCYGDKELYRFYAMHLATLGFTVVNSNYRLAPEYTYPAPLEDINTLFLHLQKEKLRHFVDLVGHVFHIDQKSEIAKECNQDEIQFFQKFL